VVVDIELEVVSLDDCSERGELFLCSVSQGEGDGEVHVLGIQPARVDRPLEPGCDDLIEHVERPSEPHRSSTLKGDPRLPRGYLDPAR
jgi:hypothetical protein